MGGQNKGAQHRLLFMLSLTTTFFLVEIIVGYFTNSMALVADSFHMLSDVVALVIAYISVLMSPKKWSKNTFGWARAEVLGALVNAVFLVALCFSILVESMKRFYKPEEIHQPNLILVVGFFGLLVNVIGLLLFKDGGHGHSHSGGAHRHSHMQGASSHLRLNEQEDNFNADHGDPPSSHSSISGPPTPPPEPKIDGSENNRLALKSRKKAPRTSGQMNMRGVFLHVLADALGSVIVCISASIIIFTEWKIKDYVDPLLSIIMVTIISVSTWPLLRESAMILLQTVPTHIQIDSLRDKLLQEINGVLAVHELHVWQLAGDRIIASAHIRCLNLKDYMRIAEKVKEFFHNEGIHSTTIQPEFVDPSPGFQSQEEQENCVLDCPENTTCAAQTCCGPKKETPKLNIHNGMYKGFKGSGSTAIRRRPRNGDTSDNEFEVPLSEINIDGQEADDSDLDGNDPANKSTTSRNGSNRSIV